MRSYPIQRLRRDIIIGTGAMTAVLLTACAQPQPQPHSPHSRPNPPGPGPATQVVEGTISWRERIALPPDAELIVQLQDTSRADAAARVLGTQRIRLHTNTPPFQFRIAVDPAQIDPRASYTISARVEHNGRLMFINDTATPVLTGGAGSRVNMMLVRTLP